MLLKKYYALKNMRRADCVDHPQKYSNSIRKVLKNPYHRTSGIKRSVQPAIRRSTSRVRKPGRLCRNLLERAESAAYRTLLSCDLSKDLKARGGSVGELLFPDHVGDLNAVRCGGSRSERLEPTHVPNTPFDKPMVLLDHVV
jgi:hypothetical protein